MALLLPLLMIFQLLTEASGQPPQSTLRVTPHYAALLRRGRTVAAGDTLALDSALAVATDAAKQAWAAAKAVEVLAKANKKFVPKIEAAIAIAEAAAATAKEEDDAATALVAKTRVAVQGAALLSAQAYYMQVRQAGANLGRSAGGPGASPSPAPAGAATSANTGPGPIEAAAVAAGRAAAPYHSVLLRGREAILDYNGRAGALESAAEKLHQESAKFQDTASMQEVSGLTLPAERMRIRAAALSDKGVQMEEEAQELRATALNTSAVFPVYRLAEKLAAKAAAGVAEAASTTRTPFPY